ncbi:MAG: hypothetical protein Q8P54_01365 [bacterium]|nr:hypothetical protein [bacterium]
MENIKIIQQKDQLLYSSIIFNKPINKLSLPRILVIGGSSEKLKNVSLCYEALQNSNTTLTLALPDTLKQAVATLEAVFLHANPIGSVLKDNTDHLLDLASDANLLIIGVDMTLGSQAQIVVEKLLQECDKPVIVTDEVIKVFQFSPSILERSSKLILFLNTNSLVKIANYLKIPVKIRPDRGIYNRADLIKSIAGKQGQALAAVSRPGLRKNYFICHDSGQIICYDSKKPNEVGLVNFEGNDLSEYLGTVIGLVGSFLADYSNEIKDFTPKVLTACFIAKEFFAKQKSSQETSIKKIINSYL